MFNLLFSLSFSRYTVLSIGKIAFLGSLWLEVNLFFERTQTKTIFFLQTNSKQALSLVLLANQIYFVWEQFGDNFEIILWLLFKLFIRIIKLYPYKGIYNIWFYNTVQRKPISLESLTSII